jgi:pimeloyl-ACP methyl ester carboxylesterase
MSDQKPTIALVHGAFAESASWNPVIERLQARGLDTVAIGNPLRSLTTDGAYVRDAIDGLGRPVVLVGHSYGGMVVTQAAAGSDSVLGLVYVAAFTPDTGESAFALSTKFPGSSLGDALGAYPVSSGGNDLFIRPDVFHSQFCADVPDAEAALMAATQRPATDTALYEALPTETPAWKDRPAWVVYGELDRNIPAELVRFMAERAGARSAHEIKGGSHAISVSRPDEVAATIAQAVDAVAPVAAPA